MNFSWLKQKRGVAFVRDVREASVDLDADLTLRSRVVVASIDLPQEKLRQIGPEDKCRTRTVYELQVLPAAYPMG